MSMDRVSTNHMSPVASPTSTLTTGYKTNGTNYSSGPSYHSSGPPPCHSPPQPKSPGSARSYSRSPSIDRSTRSTTPTRTKGHIMTLRVILLDGSTPKFDVPVKAYAKDFLDLVCNHINLLESDYFGLQYAADYAGSVYWLDPLKYVCKQVKCPTSILFRFAVKFYTPDPGQLQEEYTRYLFALQIKKDLEMGFLPCSENTAALMASYLVQGELGDYDVELHPDYRYLINYKFIPDQTDAFLQMVMKHHMTHVSQTPADADFNLLDIARRLEMYGIRLHPVRDYEGMKLHLAVSHAGILVFQNMGRINLFSWAKIRKLSFKKKNFLIKLHPETGYYKDTVEFLMSSRNACKRFWKDCIEHHAFFRMPENHQPKVKPRLLKSGSQFRYSGRTQKEMVDHVRSSFLNRNPYRRPGTLRTAARSLGARPTTTPAFGSVSSSNVGLETFGTLTRSAPPPRPPHRPCLPVEWLDGTSVAENSHRMNPSAIGGADMGGPAAEPDYENYPLPPEIHAVLRASDRQQPVTQMTNQMSGDLHVLSEDDQGGMTTDDQDGTLRTHEGLIIRSDSASSGRSHDSAHITPYRGEGGTTSQEDTDKGEGTSPTDTRPLLESPSGDKSTPETSPNRQIGSLTLRMLDGGTVKDLMVENEDTEKKRYLSNRAYFVAKEILTTERTYIKDLEVITVWFRKAVVKESALPPALMSLLFSNLDPIYEFHSTFLKEIEQRLGLWEGRTNANLKGDYQRIGDILLKTMKDLQPYCQYLDKHEQILIELEENTRKSKKFEHVYKDFEQQKVCYLPLNTFLLKPAQRLMHYQLILKCLLEYYPTEHRDYKDCSHAFDILSPITSRVSQKINKLENYQKLTELQRDLLGVYNMVENERELIREGCLLKLSRKGFQQRMIFLFSDMLLYTSRGVTSTNQFKVHGKLPLKGAVIQILSPNDESQKDKTISNTFTISSEDRKLALAASCDSELNKWLQDLNIAINICNSRDINTSDTVMVENANRTLKSDKSSDSIDTSETQEESEDDKQTSTIDKVSYHRSNTTMHVCWHRNTSVGRRDNLVALQNQLSGYLLRKFKNSNGWQKLWVVFTNFCLFFYKTYQDDYPLASLPLLGYNVSLPAEIDDINKDHVFKLQFKTHVYFFRAESEYTFNRWLEVIRSATETC